MHSIEAAEAIPTPTIRYKELSGIPVLPLNVQLDPVLTKNLISSTPGIPSEVQRNVVINVDPHEIKSQKPDGKDVELRGTTMMIPDEDGKWNINIYVGSKMLDYVDVRNAIRMYQIYAPFYIHHFPENEPKKRVEEEEKLIRKKFSPRMLSYLEVAPWERGEQFVTGMLIKRMEKSILEAVVHEVSHLRDIHEYEDLTERIDKRKSIGKKLKAITVASLMGALTAANGVDNRIAGVAGALGIISGLATVGWARFSKEIDESDREIHMLRAERHALDAHLDESIKEKWSGLVRVSQNEEYFKNDY